jgi:TM2 domain-containing membrane protein YozV
VYYFVIGDDGGRYGPADIDTLVAWAAEGRIVASTMLIDRGTEEQVRADSLSAVAAALRRLSGEPAEVVVERNQPERGEWPRATVADQGGVAGGGPPPVPGVPPIPQARPPVGRYAPGRRVGHRSKVVAGLLGIFLGGLGVHRFYMGYTGIGLLMLVLCVLGGTAGLVCIPVPCVGGGFVWLWGLVEGIICLCGGMRDADGLELRG